MAAQTLTVTAWNDIPKGIHAGDYSVNFTYSTGATKFGTASDVIFLAKVPHGAIVQDVVASVYSGADTQVLAQLLVGTSAASTTFTLSKTGGVSVIRGNGIPFKVSLSDDAAVQYANLVLNVISGTESTSFEVKGNVRLKMGP